MLTVPSTRASPSASSGRAAHRGAQAGPEPTRCPRVAQRGRHWRGWRRGRTAPYRPGDRLCPGEPRVGEVQVGRTPVHRRRTVVGTGRGSTAGASPSSIVASPRSPPATGVHRRDEGRPDGPCTRPDERPSVLVARRPGCRLLPGVGRVPSAARPPAVVPENPSPKEAAEVPGRRGLVCPRRAPMLGRSPRRARRSSSFCEDHRGPLAPQVLDDRHVAVEELTHLIRARSPAAGTRRWSVAARGRHRVKPQPSARAGVLGSAGRPRKRGDVR